MYSRGYNYSSEIGVHMTTKDFTHIRGDTFKARSFQLSICTPVKDFASLPVVGTDGVIYKTLDLGVYYKWVSTAYVVTTDRVYKDFTGASLLMQLKTAYGMSPTLSLSTGAGLTTLEPLNGKFQIDEQVIDIPGKPYLYDIEITYANGLVETDIKGTFTVQEDVSRAV